jgi:dihydrofolate reductase
MGELTYSMGVSLDGFIAGPDGDIGWNAPDQELHRFHNEQTREIGVHFCGRRLYEVMTYWDTADEDPGLDPAEREFADIWQALPKVVFSTSLERVEGNARLAETSIAEEVARAKAETDKNLSVGGAGLAADFIELGLVDEFRLFTSPVLLGGGTPFFPPVAEAIDLELVETQNLSRGVVYTRYRRA